MNSLVQVFSVAGSRPQRQALERFVEGLPGLRNLGSGNLSSPIPAHADVILAEVLDGESPQQSLRGAPNWVALLDNTKGTWLKEVRARLPRRCSETQLEAAVHAVAQGLTVTHPDFMEEAPEQAISPLSAREQEVLAFLALGRSNKEIAGQLNISEHTVKFHLASLFQKLQASSRSQAIAHGLRRGWVKL